MTRYEEAKTIYAKYGIDTEKAIERLFKISVSVHCWQRKYQRFTSRN